MNRRTAPFAAALAAGTILAGAAGADTITLRIGAAHPAGATWITSIIQGFMPQVAERVAAETDHTIVWQENWGGTVCRIGECLEAVESGLLDMADLQVPFEPSKLMGWNFSFFVPFGTGEPEIAAAASLQVYDDLPELHSLLEDLYNQVFIGIGILGTYGLVTNFTWDDPSELDGRRIAAAGPNIPWVSSIGVVPVQSNLVEAYTAMQTGVYDGWVMFPDGVTSFRLEEVSRQFTVTNFGSISTPLLTMNKDTWESLPEDVQRIFIEEGRNWNERAGVFSAQRDREALEKMEALGLRIKELTFEQQQEWAAQLPNIPAERTEEINSLGQPGEAVYRYAEILAEHGVALPRDWLAER